MEEKQNKLESDYKNIDKLVKTAEDKKKKILSDARKEGNTIIEEAKTLGSKTRDTIIESAEAEAKTMVESSKVQIEQEKLAMLGSIKSKVIDLSLKLNGKLFSDEKASKDFLEKNIDSI